MKKVLFLLFLMSTNVFAVNKNVLKLLNNLPRIYNLIRLPTSGTFLNPNLNYQIPKFQNQQFNLRNFNNKKYTFQNYTRVLKENSNHEYSFDDLKEDLRFEKEEIYKKIETLNQTPEIKNFFEDKELVKKITLQIQPLLKSFELNAQKNAHQLIQNGVNPILFLSCFSGSCCIGALAANVAIYYCQKWDYSDEKINIIANFVFLTVTSICLTISLNISNK